MQIFNVKEVANYLNCSISSIRNLVRNKEIPYFRIGNKLNFNKEAVDNWIYNQELRNMQNEWIRRNSRCYDTIQKYTKFEFRQGNC